MLMLYRRVMFGEVTNPEVSHMRDVTALEWLIFVPLIVMSVLWLGATNGATAWPRARCTKPRG